MLRIFGWAFAFNYGSCEPDRFIFICMRHKESPKTAPQIAKAAAGGRGRYRGEWEKRQEKSDES